MVDSTLTATPPLDNYSQQFGNTSLSEVTDIAIYSIGLGLSVDAAVASVQDKLGTHWPETGLSATSEDAAYVLLGLQTDQVFALVTPLASSLSLPELDDSVYITDQSDSWATLRISGPMARTALERICPIDLHLSVFNAGAVTRTSMEHMAAIILCEANNEFLLLSPTSSADSFLHAMQTSLRNVSG